jgi:hypothetical protein
VRAFIPETATCPSLVATIAQDRERILAALDYLFTGF